MDEGLRNSLGGLAALIAFFCLILAVIVAIMKRTAKEIIKDNRVQTMATASAASSVERCDNCGRTIGRLESPHVWQNHVVCAECAERLRKSA